MDAIEKYLSLEELESIIKINPDISLLEKAATIELISLLENFNIDPSTIRSLILYNPKLLTRTLYDTRDILDFLNDNTDDLSNILEAYPETLKLSLDELQKFDGEGDLEVFLMNRISK